MLILISFSFPWEFLSDMNNTFQLQTVLPHKISWRAIALVCTSFPHVLWTALLVLFQIFLQHGEGDNSNTQYTDLSLVFPFFDHLGVNLGLVPVVLPWNEIQVYFYPGHWMTFYIEHAIPSRMPHLPQGQRHEDFKYHKQSLSNIASLSPQPTDRLQND